MAEQSAIEGEVLAYLQEQMDGAYGLDIGHALMLGPGLYYPALRRLEEAGRVRSWWGEAVRPDGPRRRLYALTDAWSLPCGCT